MRENWVKIKVTDEMVKEAIWRDVNVQYMAEKKGLRNIFVVSDKWIGHIGEVAVEKYLKSTGADFKIDKPIGKSDKYDFKIGDETIDVKTGRYFKLKMKDFPKRYGFLINLRQLLNGKIDVYVHCQLNSQITYCHIVGWVTREEALRYPVRSDLASPAVTIPFEDLHPIATLTRGRKRRQGGNPHGRLCLPSSHRVLRGRGLAEY